MLQLKTFAIYLKNVTKFSELHPFIASTFSDNRINIKDKSTQQHKVFIDNSTKMQFGYFTYSLFHKIVQNSFMYCIFIQSQVSLSQEHIMPSKSYEVRNGCSNVITNNSCNNFFGNVTLMLYMLLFCSERYVSIAQGMLCLLWLQVFDSVYNHLLMLIHNMCCYASLVIAIDN